MSSGPGRWQRMILDALYEYEIVPLLDLARGELEREPTRAEMVALRRAARVLAEAGQLLARYKWRCTRCGALDMYLGKCCGRVTHVLIVTRDPDTRGVLLEKRPSWISVASVQNGTEATLMATRN